MKSISQAQYERLHPYLPVQRGNVRISNLTLINAVLYIAENGCKWRALPKEYGNWHTIYMRLSRWSKSGVLDRLFKALQVQHVIKIKVECLGLDSSSVKVHPDGMGALKKMDLKPWKYDHQLCKRRNEIERLFRRLKAYRRFHAITASRIKWRSKTDDLKVELSRGNHILKTRLCINERMFIHVQYNTIEEGKA